jgi:hypothetical protein
MDRNAVVTTAGVNVRCTAAGMTWEHHGQLMKQPWENVSEMHVKRAEHGRPDFRSLTLAVAGSTRRFSSTGRGCVPVADAEVAFAFFARHVGADRMRVVAIHGAPATLVEADERLS